MYTFTIEAPANTKNKGDAAILNGNLLALEKIFPKSKINILNRNPEEQRKIFPNIVDSYFRIFDEVLIRKTPQFIKLIELIFKSCAYLCWIKFKKFPIDKRAKKIFKIYQKSDFIIYTGGGYLGGPYLSLNILIAIYLAKKLGKRVCITGISIEQPKKKIIKYFIKYILNKVEFISVREPQSLNLLQSLKINSPIYLTADYALLVDCEKISFGNKMLVSQNIPENKTVRIGFGVKQIPKLEINQDKFRISEKKIATAIELILKKINALIVFFPIDISYQQDDRIAANSVKEMVSEDLHERIFILNGDYRIEELKAMIGTMDIFIGIRFHSTIFALSMGIPTISIPYMKKNQGIMEMTSLERWTLPFENFNSSQLVNLVIEILEEKDNVKKIINTNIMKLKDSALENVQLLKKFMK